MKILLVLPATEPYRVTREHPEPPRRAALRFSLLSLTAVAAATPLGHEATRTSCGSWRHGPLPTVHFVKASVAWDT